MILDQINYEGLLVPLNKFYDLYTGGSRRAVFHDIKTTCPALLELDQNYAVIREELLSHTARQGSDAEVSRARPDAVPHLGHGRIPTRTGRFSRSTSWA